MKEIIREAALGQIIRFVSRNRLLRYPEEYPGFILPFDRLTQKRKLSEINEELNEESAAQTPPIETELEAVEEAEPAEPAEPMHNVMTAEDVRDRDVEKTQTSQSHQDLNKLTSVKSLSRTQTIPYTRERFEVERELIAQREVSLPIQPEITSTGQILVTWYTTDDQDNPQNWSQKKKSYVSFLIW
jgi:DHA1 family multidrug resistance protein-like MFS transporter